MLLALKKIHISQPLYIYFLSLEVKAIQFMQHRNIHHAVNKMLHVIPNTVLAPGLDMQLANSNFEPFVVPFFNDIAKTPVSNPSLQNSIYFIASSQNCWNTYIHNLHFIIIFLAFPTGVILKFI